MYSYKEIIKALSECIQEMNTGLIKKDHIQNCISLIQIRTALLAIVDIINDDKLQVNKEELDRIKIYADLCMSVLNVYRNICEIGTEIYKEEYLSEESCRVVMNKFDYVLKRVSSILDNKNLSSMLYPFIDYVTKRINLYHNRVEEIIRKGHIK